MIQNGYVAGFTALLLLFGHIAIFCILYSLPIAPDARQEIEHIVIPVTAAAFMSAVLYVIKRKNIHPEQTEKVSYLFAIFVSIVPLILLIIICFALWGVESRAGIEALKGTIATVEAVFGGAIVLLIDAVFGQSINSQSSKGTVNGASSTSDGVD